MEIKLIAVGTKMPNWVNEAYQDYARRLPHEYRMSLIEIAAPKRNKNSDIEKIMQMEQQAILKHTQPTDCIIALDRVGKILDTMALSKKLQTWHDQSQNLCLLIGGPEGLHNACLDTAHERWSLSALTLPHPLVRVMIAEQIYRAWSILCGHPYHR